MQIEGDCHALFIGYLTRVGKRPNLEQDGDSTEVFIDLQKNDDSYGIPHGTLNKKHKSNQEDSPHLPEFSNKINLSIRIDASPSYKRVGVFVKFCFRILIISCPYRGIGESGFFFGGGENGKNIFIGSINLYIGEVKIIVIKKNGGIYVVLDCYHMLPY